MDVPTALMMMKAALPPAIALAMYQADAIAQTYTTLGYLVAIISILGFCIMPRAKFIQTMTLNVLAVCIGSAVGLLMVWSAVQARLHTKPAGPPQPYNSSQSAVCAIWLFFQIWLVNLIKAKLPQFAFPTIIYAILVNVAATYGPQFQTTAQAESFIQRLLETFLTGLAIATGVSLFIIPVTCRKVVTKQMIGYIGLLRATLQAEQKYLQSLETSDIFSATSLTKESGRKNEKKQIDPSPEVQALKKLTAGITELHGKLYGDLPFAKREVALGKLTPDDFEGIFKHLRRIMMPLMGLGTLVDIFDRHAETNRWDAAHANEATPETTKLREKTVQEWNEIMQSIHEPFARIIQAMDQGLEHALLRLQFIKPPKRKNKGSDVEDTEARGDSIKPGDDDFTDYLQRECEEFGSEKSLKLKAWAEDRGVEIGDSFPGHAEAFAVPDEIKLEPTVTHRRGQRQLYVLLYVVFLLNSIASAVLDFARFADKRNQSKAKTRLIFPKKKQFSKWVASTFRTPDATTEDNTTVADIGGQNTVVYLGSAFKTKKDPEHLPPRNVWEKFGNFIRGISHLLGSPESSFGFRCACATMSIAIIAYLKDTQRFFVEQRLVWAMIMVAISMTPTAGQSYFSFILRVFGSIAAMVAAFLIWYIPDEHTAGVIVFLWVFVALGFYIPLKHFNLVIIGLISVVTATLIVGYELEVKKIGKELATSNGQPFYPIYELGPYRVATVVGGLFVAFIWTFFPYPISEHSALRQKLGGALYLSANLYSIIHETVLARIRDDEGDLTDPKSPGFQLSKARNKVFAKQMLLLQGLRMHSNFVKWEVPLGGKFPKKEYDEIIQLVSNLLSHSFLISYASETFTHPSLRDPNSAQWFQDFRRIVGSAELTSHEITSLLAMLSSSITNGQPLPPYLNPPEKFQLSKGLAEVDQDILSIRHISEPGYAAFAVLQISTRCINMDLEKLLRAVKKLVGELDFSFHIVSTQSESESASTDTLVRTPTRSSGRSKQD
ncbi:hypothetical protein EJ04DRAFT_462988 [Polyplosphaeria fusca]|uniref:ER transporter 6TM N-terminal domain-containing protein n=1 Tax=Polyplosphaeria fusca TaxID=682080 RepID=A0A9P4R4J4_9PLEO|nr:hypothetical protein EJ04DRAFT_462988 [Polyplosphaeria fusca]